MADALPWDDVAKNPDYQALPDEQKVRAREQYFDQNIAPQVPQEHIDAAWKQFDSYANPSLGRRVMSAAGNAYDAQDRVGQAAIHGAEEGWGSEPLHTPPDSPEMGEYAIKPGEDAGVGKRLANATLRAVGDVVRTPLRAFNAGVRGFGAAAQQTGEEIGQPELGKDVAALPEAFPFFGHEIGGFRPKLGPDRGPGPLPDEPTADARPPSPGLLALENVRAGRPATQGILEGPPSRPALEPPRSGPAIEAGAPGEPYTGEAAGRGFTMNRDYDQAPYRDVIAAQPEPRAALPWPADRASRGEGFTFRDPDPEPPGPLALPKPDTTYGEGFTARPAPPAGPIDFFNDLVNAKEPGALLTFPEVEKATGVRGNIAVRGILDQALEKGQLEKVGNRYRVVTTPDLIDQAAAETNVAPTEAQKEAGNYAKGKIDFQGLPITIETPRGVERTGIGADGKPWAVTSPNHYGYIRKTEGADGEHVDAYIGPDPAAKTAFVVDQKAVDTGAFDEHKILLGYPDLASALDAYGRGFSDKRGDERIGGVRALTIPELKGWLKDGDTKAPAAEIAVTSPDALKPVPQTPRGTNPRFRVGKPLDIVQFLAKSGGLNDRGGDISAIIGKPNQMIPFHGKLINRETGVGLDKALEKATAAGYFPEAADVGPVNKTGQYIDRERALVDAIRDTIAGKRYLRPGDAVEHAARADYRQSIQDGRNYLDENGYDHKNVRDADVPAVVSKIEAMRRETEAAMDAVSQVAPQSYVDAFAHEPTPEELHAQTIAELEARPAAAEPRGAAEDARGPGAERVGEGAGEEGAGRGEPGDRGREAAGPAVDEEYRGWLAETPEGKPGETQSLDVDFHKFLQDRSYTSDPIGLNRAAGDFVIQRGNDTGNESMVSYDRYVRKVGHAITTNEPMRVRFTREMDVAGADPNNRLIVHHNHPGGSALSGDDIGALAGNPGIEWAVAHTHNGDLAGARLNADFRQRIIEAAMIGKAPSTDVARALNFARRALAQTHWSIGDSIAGVMRDAIRGKRVTVADANRIHAEIANRAMAKAGLIDYVSSHSLDGINKPLIDQLTSIAEREARRIRDEMKITKGIADDNADRSAYPVSADVGLGKILSIDASGAEGRPGGRNGSMGAREGPQGVGEQSAERRLVESPEESPATIASRQRAAEKQKAELAMRGKKVAKKPQAEADDLPLFGGERQGRLLEGDGPYDGESKMYGGGPGTDELGKFISAAARKLTPKFDPLHEWTRGLEDKLYEKVGKDQSAAIGALQWLKALPEEARSMKAQENIYHAVESEILGKGADAELTPAEQEIKRKFVDPIREKAAAELSKIRNLVKGEPGGDAIPEEIEKLMRGYIHNIVAGKGSIFDRVDPSDMSRGDPILGRSLSKNAPSLKSRTVYMAEGDNGTNQIVIGDFKPGDKFTDGKTGENFTIRQATTKEKESGTPLLYHKNALANSLMNYLQLRRARNNMELLEEIKKDPTFKENVVAQGSDARVPSGWRTTDLPQLRGYYLHPKIANALDDFYNRGVKQGDLGRAMAGANRMIIGALFVNPISGLAYHGNNVLMHWLIGRGWENLLPHTWAPSARNFARAYKQVTQLGPDYRRFLENGAGMLYGGVETRNLYDMMLKLTAKDITDNPGKWGPLAKAWGYANPVALTKALLHTGSRWLWGVNDVLMMQRYYDLMHQGMSMKQAIKAAERDIPNYRIPSELWNGKGGRAASEFMQNPAIQVFGRYHYGLLKGMADMARDAVKGTGKERVEAMGKIFTLGVLAFAIQPLINSALQAITGNDEAEWVMGGPVKLVNTVIKMTQGQKELRNLLPEFMTPNPTAQAAVEAMFNTQAFNRGKIYGPTDTVGHKAAEIGLWAASKLNPLNQLINTMSGKWSPGQTIGTMLGAKLPSEKAQAGKRRGQQREKQEDKSLWRRTNRTVRELSP